MDKNTNVQKTVISLIIALLVFVGIYFLYKELAKANLAKVQSEQTYQSEAAKPTIAGEATSSAETNAAQAQDYTAPEIKVTDQDGNEVTLADFKGKTLVLNFWASWCPPCKAEFPDFQKFYDEHKDNDKIAMVLINLVGSNGETKAKADAFIKDNKYTLPYVYDVNGQTAATYMIQSIPTTYIINPAGELYSRNTGIMSYEKLVEAVGKAGEQ